MEICRTAESADQQLKKMDGDDWNSNFTAEEKKKVTSRKIRKECLGV